MALYGMREDLPSKIDQFGPELTNAINDAQNGLLPGARDLKNINGIV